MKTVLAMSALAGSALAGPSPVQKVVQLLGELKNQVQGELDTEAKAMDEYTNYCENTAIEKNNSIKVAKSDIERFEATVEDSNGKIQSFTSVIEQSGATVAAKEGKLSEASALRKEENKNFVAAEKELVDSIDMLNRAKTVLKRELSFAQGASASQLKSKLGPMVDALALIVGAESGASAKKVQAFLQDDDDLSLVQQPQASTSNYESKSGGIVDAIQELADKASDELATLRGNETKSRHEFELLKQSLEDEVANLKKVIADSQGSRATATETKSKAEEDLSRTQKSLSADQESLKTLQSECQIKAQEWEARQKSAAEEMKALAAAKDILTQGVSSGRESSTVSFVQVKSSEDVRQQLVQKLRGLSRKFHNFGLMQLVSKASSDPFVKVRGLVETMIAKLEKQAQEEATQEAWCQDENKKSQAKREKHEASVSKYQTRLDKATANVATLEGEIKTLTEEVAAIEKSDAEATKIRGEENEEYKKASTEQKQAVEAVARAIQVLQEYYGGASLLQQPSFGGAKSDSGSNIVSFLEVAESDFSSLLAETESNEEQAAKAFEKMTQENAVSKATKEASIKGKNSEVQSLKVAITDSQGDLKTSNTELDAVNEYIEKLKPQCESKAMSYAERKERREAEMAGLREALEILAGDAPASFMQKRKVSGQTFLGFSF